MFESHTDSQTPQAAGCSPLGTCRVSSWAGEPLHKLTALGARWTPPPSLLSRQVWPNWCNLTATDSSSRIPTASKFAEQQLQADWHNRSTLQQLTTSALSAAPSAPLVDLDPHRLSQRQRQIDFGKNTVGYSRYVAQVEKCAAKAPVCSELLQDMIQISRAGAERSESSSL